MAAPTISRVVVGTGTLSVQVDSGEALVFLGGTHQGDVTSVAFNGDAMTEVVAANTAFNETVQIFYLPTPDVGTYNLTWSASGSGDRGCAIVIAGQKTTGQPILFAQNGDDTEIVQISNSNKTLFIGGSYGEASLTMATGLGLTERDNYSGASYENFAVASAANDNGIQILQWSQSSGQRNAVASIAIQGSDATDFPILFDNATNGGETLAASSKTTSHTVGTLTNGIIVAHIGLRDTSTSDIVVSGVTYNGVAMTKLRSDLWNTTAFVGEEIWYLKNPAAGAHNVVVTMTGTVDRIDLIVSSWQGVDQTTQFEANAGTGTITTAATGSTVNITPTSNNSVILDSMYTKDDVSVAQNSAQVLLTGSLTGSSDAFGASFKRYPTAGATSMAWTWSNSDGYAHGVGVLKPASGLSTLTTTFSIDGIVKEINTKTFTIDGIVKEINTTTFTLDGIVLKATNASFTIDGIVLKATDAPFTIDGIVLYTTTTTFTIDGFILTQPTTTFTIDGIVLRATDASFTIDGMVLRATDTSFTIDGIVKEINTTTFTIDGIVLKATDATFTIDGIVLFTDTETFTIDAIVLRAYETTFTIDGLVLEVNTKTFTIDGVVLKTDTTTFTIDGIVFSTNDKTFTIDAVVLMADQKTFTIDGIVLYTTTQEFTIDGLVKETNSTSFTIDGIVLKATTAEFTIDGIVFTTNTTEFTIDGLVNTSAGLSFTIDAIVLRATDATFTLDGIVKEINSTSFTIDGLVLRTTDATFTIDGVVFFVDTETFTIDAVILNADQKTFTLDGIVLRGSTIEFTVGGVVKEVHSTLFTIDGLTKEINTTQFSIDGIVKTIESSSFTIDSVVKTIQTIEFTIDGVVVLAESSTTSFTIDAEVVIPTYSSPGGKTIRGLYTPHKDNSKGLAGRRNEVYGEDEKYRPLVSPWSDKLNIWQ